MFEKTREAMQLHKRLCICWFVIIILPYTQILPNLFLEIHLLYLQMHISSNCPNPPIYHFPFWNTAPVPSAHSPSSCPSHFSYTGCPFSNYSSYHTIVVRQCLCLTMQRNTNILVFSVTLRLKSCTHSLGFSNLLEDLSLKDGFSIHQDPV